jgi:hypothetical protein
MIRRKEPLVRTLRATVVTVLLAVVCAASPSYAYHDGPGYKACERGRDKDFLDHTWYGQTMNYYVIRSSFPPQANTVRKQNRVLQRVKEAAARWGHGSNWCDKDNFYGFKSHFVDDKGEVEGQSSNNHSDRYSTIDFADGKCFGLDTLGCATTRSEHPVRQMKAGRLESAIASDIRFRRSADYYFGKRRYAPTGTAKCPGTDFFTLAMHEMGHAVGEDDLYDDDPASETPGENRGQVMGGASEECLYHRRYLGRADYIMLRELYTPLFPPG